MKEIIFVLTVASRKNIWMDYFVDKEGNGPEFEDAGWQNFTNCLMVFEGKLRNDLGEWC